MKIYKRRISFLVSAESREMPFSQRFEAISFLKRYCNVLKYNMFFCYCLILYDVLLHVFLPHITHNPLLIFNNITMYFFYNNHVMHYCNFTNLITIKLWNESIFVFFSHKSCCNTFLLLITYLLFAMFNILVLLYVKVCQCYRLNIVKDKKSP